ncbi:MAG: 6-bladed beta-propeller [Tannerella sp.]|jgi:hypothetical protein|nr:6-bladed beta-propeller [Tannerella sp.]
MKHGYIFSFIMICILFAGCKKQTDPGADGESEFYTIDYEQCFETEKQMAISEIADSVEYIELKTPEDIIVTRIWDVKQVDDYLVIKARLDVYLFHKNGQFIRQIGSRGQGPREYIVPVNVEIDRKKKEIIISDTEKLLFYDLEGNFLCNKKLKDVTYIGIFDSIIWISDITTNRQKCKAVAFSLQNVGDTIACIPNPLYGPIKNSGSTAIIRTIFTMFYHKNDALYFKGDVSNDTIWKLSGVHAVPYAFIDMGKYKMPVEFEAWYSSYDTFVKNNERYWGVSSLVENDHYFFFFSQNRGSTKDDLMPKYIVYDKQQKKGFSVKDSKGVGLTDDLLGGPPVWPRWITDEYYIDMITAHELLEHTKSGTFTPPSPLKEQLSRMNGESNDLVILCRRKT